MLSNLEDFYTGPILTLPQSPNQWQPMKNYLRRQQNVEERPDTGHTEHIVKVTEKVYLEPPSASDIAAELTDEQLRIISDSLRQSVDINKELNADEIVQKILISPNFQNVVNNFNKVELTNDRNEEVLIQQQKLIDDLKEELNKLSQV
nr:unnamed protein product [Callosobruchus analis]